MPVQNANLLINQAKRRTLFSGSILIFVASIVLSVVIIYPQITHILETKSALTKKNEEVKKLKTKAKQLSEDLIQVEYFTNNDLVQLTLPNNKPLLEVLTSLDQVKRASEVELYDLKTNPGLLATGSGKISSNKKNLADSMPLEFTIKGDFEKVSLFMDLLEKVAPFTTITAFEIAGGDSVASTADNPNEPEILQVDLETKTFFYNPNVQQALTAPLPQLSQENNVVLAKLAEFLTIPLPEQREITGGGSEDIFGVDPLKGLWPVEISEK